MEINDMIKLMQAVTEHDLTSFKLEEGDLKLSIKKEKQVTAVMASQELPYTQVKLDSEVQSDEINGSGEKKEICSDKVVFSPLVGTFYHSSSPESEVFVKVGDSVKKGQTLGIIEAMKLMNEIESEYDGIVEAILVGNEDMVEYGQPLFRIR